MSHLDRMTQEIASLAQRSSAAASDLGADGERLRKIVNAFRSTDTEIGQDAMFGRLETGARATTSPALTERPGKPTAHLVRQMPRHGEVWEA
ncbi:hypothetical protein MXD81_17240, partial [Microbacteriaceae bacterium K1510]|nr:hypothetical protein [Microbacteriaceae bacterium K1510]